MNINRREFAIATAALAACVCSGVGLDSACAIVAPSSPVDVGAAGDYPSDGAVDKFARSNRIIVIRKGDRLYATAATCTHRECIVKPVQGELRCPCHGSRFDLEGAVTKGPARAPLPRYAIAINSAGRILVDPSQKFDQSQWDDPRSFVKIA